MEIRSIEDCFKLRLLRKIKPDKEKAVKSLEIAKQRLTQVDKAIKLNFFQYAILEAYMAMFHVARALLYKEGVQEKSHFAVYIYLKDRYGDRIPSNILNFLNIHRIERHEAMYGLDYKPERQDALIAMEDAKVFVRELERFI